MSRPKNLIEPPVIAPFRPMCRMMASATVDFPQPELADESNRFTRHHREIEIDDRRHFAAARVIADAEILALEDRYGALGVVHAQSRSEISRRPSASMLSPSTMVETAIAGHSMALAPKEPNFCAALIMLPQSGSGGGRPRPR